VQIEPLPPIPLPCGKDESVLGALAGQNGAFLPLQLLRLQGFLIGLTANVEYIMEIQVEFVNMIFHNLFKASVRWLKGKSTAAGAAGLAGQ
jgi:hypothetical protein